MCPSFATRGKWLKRLQRQQNIQNLANVPGFVLCIGKFLDVSFGQEGINKRFDQVFIFLVQFFHFFKRAEQFFVCKRAFCLKELPC